jgi:hypothetical protein
MGQVPGGGAHGDAISERRRGTLPPVATLQYHDPAMPPDSLLSISFASTRYSAANFRSPHLRFAVTHIVSVPLTFGSLISQIDGAWGHGRPSSKGSHTAVKPSWTLIKRDHWADFE